MAKRYFSIALALMMLIVSVPVQSLFVQAATVVDSGYCGASDDGKNLTWTLDSDGKLIITGTGIMDNFKSVNSHFYDSTRTPPWQGAKSVVVENGVIYIGDNAFSGCTELTTVTIANSVIDIGTHAFKDTPWYNAQPEGVVYAGGVAIGWKGDMPEKTSLKLKEGTVGIADFAFSFCENLSSFVFPGSLKYIGRSAFEDCKNLTAAEIPEGVAQIGSWAFHGCESLQSVSIPGSLKAYGGDVFEGCRKVRSVSIGDGLDELVPGMFMFGTWLVSGDEPERVKLSVRLPEGPKTLPVDLFYGAPLGPVEIPASIENISNDAFLCAESYSVAEGNKAFRAVDGALYTMDGTELVFAPSGCTSFKVMDGVRLIRNHAFRNCTELTELYLPDSVEWVGQNVFSGCAKLRSIRIPEKTVFHHAAGLENTAWFDAFPDGEMVYAGCCAYSIKGEIIEYIYNGDQVEQVGNYIEISIPEGIERLCSTAFKPGVSKIRIPSTVYNLIQFMNSSGVKWFIGPNGGWPEIEVSENSPYYFVNDQIIYSKDMKTLLFCLPQKTGRVEIPDTVERIAENAFSYCDKITEIVVPASVNTVETNALACNPKKVVFLGVVENITTAAFGSMENTEIVKPTQMTIPEEYNPYYGENGSEVVDGVIYNGTAVLGFRKEGQLKAELRNGTEFVSLVDDAPPEILLPNSINHIHMPGGNYWPTAIDLYYNGTEKDFSLNVTCTLTSDLLECYNIHFLRERVAPAAEIDTEDMKEIGEYVYAAPSTKAAALLAAAGAGAVLTDKNGNPADENALLASGMTLVKPDGSKRTVVVKGDNNGDGAITASDARFALRTAVGLEKPNDWQKKASHVAGKTTITAADARLILRAAVNLEKLKLF